MARGHPRAVGTAGRHARLPDGSRDGLCKGTGWIEILGSGMVDPNVYGFVAEMGYDPERIAGFVHIGRAKTPPEDRPRPALDDIVSYF